MSHDPKAPEPLLEDDDPTEVRPLTDEELEGTRGGSTYPAVEYDFTPKKLSVK